jgi:2-phosphoglycerate kinase
VGDVDRLGDITHRVELQNAESKALWPFVVDLLRNYDMDGLDVLVEGVAVLPELVKNFPLPYKAIFVGNTNKIHVETIVEHSRNNTHDWLHVRDEAYVREYATFVAAFSAFTKAEAQKHGMSYVEMQNDDYEAAQQRALRLLLAN